MLFNKLFLVVIYISRDNACQEVFGYKLAKF